MAYCSQCGAYLADGFEKCPACGKSVRDTEKKKAREDSWDIYEDNGYKGGAAAYKRQHQESRQSYDSYESRETQGEKQEFDPGEWSYADPVYDAQVIYDVPDGATRLFAALSYWSWLFIIPLIFKKDDPFVKLHLNQGLVLFIISVLSGLVGFLGWVVNVIAFIMCVAGFINAVRGKDTKLPLVGEIVIIK